MNYTILGVSIMSIPAKGYLVRVAWADGAYFRVTERGLDHWPTEADVQYIAGHCSDAPADVARQLFPFITHQLTD